MKISRSVIFIKVKNGGKLTVVDNLGHSVAFSDSFSVTESRHILH